MSIAESPAPSGKRSAAVPPPQPPAPPTATPAPEKKKKKPAPSRIDTRVFLSVSIVLIFGAVTFILLFKPIAVDDKTYGSLAMLLGVLVATFKDVYAYSFGTTKDSGDKNQIISSQSTALAQSAPVIPPVP